MCEGTYARKSRKGKSEDWSVVLVRDHSSSYMCTYMYVCMYISIRVESGEKGVFPLLVQTTSFKVLVP